MAESVQLTTRGGVELDVRLATPDDGQLIEQLFRNVGEEDLRFRFLSGMRKIGPEQIHSLIDFDPDTTQSYILFDRANGQPVAAAMLAWDDGKGEIAVSIHAGYKARGIGWETLSFLSRKAKDLGLTEIGSIEDRSNHYALEVERDFGFTITEMPDDPSLLLVRKSLV